jgi:hypothetical protein
VERTVERTEERMAGRTVGNMGYSKRSQRLL